MHGVLIVNPRDLPAMIAEMKSTVRLPQRRQYAVQRADARPGFEQIDFSALQITLGGGMAVQSAVAERWKEVDGLRPDAGLGPHRDFAGACINPPLT